MPAEKSKKDHGLLISLIEAVTEFLAKFSLGKKVEGWVKNENSLDFYILFWLVFEITVLISLAYVTVSGLMAMILTIVLGYHLFEIAVTSFSSVVIAPIQNKKHSSVPRKFSLVLVNYLEVILIFTIIFCFVFESDSVLKNLQTSVSIVTLTGATLDQESNAIFVAVIIEMLFGIFFVTGLIGSIANYIGNKE